MLDEYRHIYEQEANKIAGWKTINKNQLCNDYINAPEHLRDAYFSAILCRYWNNIDKYMRDSSGQFTADDGYNCLLHAITYALEHKAWLDEKQPVYNDPKGPDKVINRCIKTTRVIFLQALNMDKRRLNMNLISIDKLIDDLGDMFYTTPDNIDYSEEDIISTIYINDIVRQFFYKKEYTTVFLIYIILTKPVFDHLESGKTSRPININKICNYLQKLSEKDCISVSQTYSLDLEKVKHASTYCINVSKSTLIKRVNNCLDNLKKVFVKEP